MKYNESIFTDFPELTDIGDQLEETFKEHERLKKEAKRNFESKPELQRERTVLKPDEFRVARYMLKNGEWQETIYTNKSGRKEYVAQLKRCMDNYDPEAIVIIVYPKHARGVNPREYPIYFNKDAKVDDSKRKTSEMSFEEMKSQILGTIEEKIQDKTSGADSQQMKHLQMGFTHQIEMMEMKRKHDDAINALNRQLEAAHDELKGAEEEIAELKEELEGSEKALGSVHSEYERKEKAKEENPIVTILSAVALQAGEKFVVRNPELLDGFNLSENQKTSLIKKLQENGDDKAEGNVNSAGASFNDAGTDKGLEGKDAKHIEAIQNIYNFCKQLPLEDFKKLYQVFISLCTDNGELNHENADKLIGFLNSMMKQNHAESEPA